MIEYWYCPSCRKVTLYRWNSARFSARTYPGNWCRAARTYGPCAASRLELIPDQDAAASMYALGGWEALKDAMAHPSALLVSPETRC